ncbi:hypothetical protein [Pedobacter chitinilyticus]|uniref:Uncharacterized protein n=1 Tax=Pedobacter chitinilyticus TaxID=2233776 RepID=A0A3S3PIS5_9SPHI|nr:hypothetical protein [Pedobacter chitinilyticus]RWU10571.1 hypothetical protein DPV69_04325 [Pedobacter chitinilyticus]
MAISKNNPIVDGASGRFGNNLVFRKRGNRTVMAVRPSVSERVPTEDQMTQRFLFMEASFYAKSVLENPVLKAAYQAKAKEGQSAYNVAFKDYLTAPILHKLDWSKYTGELGSTLTGRITDVLAVTTVKMSLFDVNDVLIEEGLAVQSELKLDWVYTATVAHTPVVGTRILVQMTDTPGNVYVEEVVIV